MQDQYLTTAKQRIKKLLPKLKCAFHQNQTLTNFCSNKKCLLPLCPSCIKIHTIQHINMKTDPQYDNLSDEVLNLNVQIKDFITIFQQNHRYLTETQQRISQYKDQIFNNIQNMKKGLFDQIQKFFNDVSKQVDHKLSQIKYIQTISQHKNQVKKTILLLKKLDKSLFEQNSSGKFIIRTLIKFHSTSIDQNLQKFDYQCKNIASKLQKNFCAFSLRQNFKQNLIDVLSQSFKINFSQITLQIDQKTKEVLNTSKKLSQLTQNNKLSQKSQIKNSLSKVISKMNNGFSSQKKKQNQNKFNQTISYQKQDYNDLNELDRFSQINNKIFFSGNRRSFMNHSSQRKSLNVSHNYCDQNSIVTNNDLSISENQNSFKKLNQNSCKRNQRKSVSKGKGLSLIQPNYKVNLDDSRDNKVSGIRFSLSSIQNINFDLTHTKPTFIHRRK